MAFGFFKDKSTGPREVTCPLCQHTQQESPLAVSSYCKGCKAYLSFGKDGEVEARGQTIADPFADRPAQPKVDIEYKAREERGPTPPAARNITKEQTSESKQEQIKKEEPKPEPTPAPEATPKVALVTPPEAPAKQEALPKIKEPKEIETAVDKPPPQAQAPSSPPEPTQTEEAETEEEDLIPRYHRQLSEEDELDSRSSKKKAATERLVACFECGDTHIANVKANSTQCRKCGRLISLEDRHIKEAWSSQIQTRGDVYIHKKGVVSGASIQCHNLIVEGDFTGSAECSGDLTLRRHGKILGKVVCDRLLVQRRAKVEFHNIVEMNECKIDGLVTGNLSCRGRLSLEKRATLTGDIKVGTLTVADGAKHTGQIQMGGF